VELTGRIAAGRELEAVATDEANSLAFELSRPARCGDATSCGWWGQSMVRASTEDSDLLVVEEDETPPDEAVVVAFCGTGRRRP